MNNNRLTKKPNRIIIHCKKAAPSKPNSRIRLTSLSTPDSLWYAKFQISAQQKDVESLTNFNAASDLLTLTDQYYHILWVIKSLLNMQLDFQDLKTINQVVQYIHDQTGLEKQQISRDFIQNLMYNLAILLCANYQTLPEYSYFLLTVQFPYFQDFPLKYTVILDLDETLVYYQPKTQISKPKLHFRPFLKSFMEYIYDKFNKGYADWAISKFCPYEIKRLYRHHSVCFNQNFYKDITRIGSNLETTIMVDNNPQLILKCLNTWPITTWQGDKNDNELMSIIQKLQTLL